MSTDPLDYSPSILDLQEAADARGEDGPLDNPGTAYRVVKDQANEIERLRAAIIRAPCTQHSIPCGWPCDSELPCWKQLALGSDCEASDG